MNPDVTALLAALQHPHHAAIERLRRVVLAVDTAVRESVKWNAPSYATQHDFATMHLRAKSGIQLILHAGVKKRPDLNLRAQPDPEGLLRWLADDRAVVALADLGDLERKEKALGTLLAGWLSAIALTPSTL